MDRIHSMRKYIILILLFFTALVSPCEVRQVQKFEGGAKIGASVPLGGFHGAEGAWTASHLGLDLRYNLKAVPVDVGAFLLVDMAYYKYRQIDENQINRSLMFGIEGNYNFRRGSKFSPYAGLGIGLGHHDTVHRQDFSVGGTTPVFLPHIGVEMLYHLRLEAGFMIARKGCNVFELSLGVVIGGRPKK